MRSTPEVTRRRLRPAVLLVALLLSEALLAGPEDQRQALDALRGRIAQLQSELDETRGERNEVRQNLRDTERRIGGLVRDLRATAAREQSESRRLTTLEQSRHRLRDELGTRRHELEQAVRAAYLLGRQEQLKLLLSQEDPARVGRVLVYYRYLGEARATRIAGITTTLKRLDITEKQIGERQQLLAELRTGQTRQKQALESARTERRSALTRLNAEVRSQSQKIESLKQDEARLTRLVQELRTALARSPVPVPPEAGKPASQGRWPLPVKGRLTARYGSPRATGEMRWRGIFLAAAEGSEIRAVTRGRVAYADWLRGFGLLLVLDHGNGLMTLYGHNQSLYKGVGDWAEAGEAIATSGNTGGPAEPGLYFEVREQGEPRDPLNWCKL